MVREEIPRRIGLDPVRDIQVLAPMHRGSLGIRELNTALQAALNPPRPLYSMPPRVSVEITSTTSSSLKGFTLHHGSER